MDRREILKQIALLTGAAVIGEEFFLTGCKNNDKALTESFSESDISFFDEVAESIIPRTNTPGAKEAGVGKLMASYSTDCYEEGQLNILKGGIGKLNAASEKEFGKKFLNLSASQKKELLTEIDAEAKKYNEEMERSKKEMPAHYFTLIKQLVLLGFFTSKPGVTQVLRYVPVPGKYEGCVEYKEGETSWA